MHSDRWYVVLRSADPPGWPMVVSGPYSLRRALAEVQTIGPESPRLEFTVAHILFPSDDPRSHAERQEEQR